MGNISKYILIFWIIIIVVGGGFLIFKKYYWPKVEIPDEISSFEECVAAGNAIMESYPRQCKAGEKVFIEDLGILIYKDLIKITSLKRNQVIASPLSVSGEARGNWYFEASFPVYLYDANNKEVAVGIAQAQSDWMTTEYVPFSVTLTFIRPDSTTGFLVFKKDNPSGLPEYDDELAVPIRFELSTAGGKDCYIGGCSGQICSDDPNTVSTCEWKEEYSCYQKAKCERQADGQCGWTQTESLSQCLNSN